MKLTGITKGSLINGVSYDSARNRLAILASPMNRNVTLYMYYSSKRIFNQLAMRKLHQFDSYWPNKVYLVGDKLYCLAPGEDIVRVYDAHTGSKVATYKIHYHHRDGEEIEALALNRTGRYVAVLTNYSLLVLSLTTNRTVYRISCKVWKDPLVALSTNLHCAIVAHGNCCTVFNLDNKLSNVTFNTRQAFISDVQLAPRGHYFSTSCGPVIDIWQLRPQLKRKPIIVHLFRAVK